MRDAVRMAVSTPDAPDPCGVPVAVGSISPRVPSRQMAVCRLVKKTLPIGLLGVGNGLFIGQQGGQAEICC